MKLRRRVLVSILLALLVAALLVLLPSMGGGDDGLGIIRRDTHTAQAAEAIRLAPGETPEAGGPELVGRPASPRDASPGRGELRVTVLGPGDRPLPGALVLLERPGAGDREVEKGRTDGYGVACFADVAFDGSAEVFAREEDGLPRAWGGAEAAVEGGEVTLHVHFGIPFEVRPVAAETGWKHTEATVLPPVEPRGNDREVLDAGGERFTYAHRGQHARPGFEVEAPHGWVAWESGGMQVPVSTWATRLVHVTPLRREVDTHVTVLDHEGMAEGSARVTEVKLAGRSFEPTGVESVAKGRFRIGGLPFFRGEPIEIGATSSRLLGVHYGSSHLPTHPADRAEVVVKLPTPEEEPLRGGHSDSFSRRGDFEGRVSRRGGLKSTLRLRVLRRDGTPAAHALFTQNRVRYRLDENGEFETTHAAPGRQEVIFKTFGMLPTRGETVTKVGAETLLELQEPQGGTIDLRVSDVDGEPLPFARVAFVTPSDLPYVDEKHGIQRVDPYVDHEGRRRFDHVESGTIRVRIHWASRSRATDVEVREGKVTHADLVLPPRS